MKILFTLIVAILTGYVNGDVSRGADVAITLTVSGGGGTNYLNTKSKLKEGGELNYTLKGESETIITHIYNILPGEKGNLILSAVLIKKQKGLEDNKWKKSIPIPKEGKTVLNPFKGVEMKIEVKQLGGPA